MNLPRGSGAMADGNAAAKKNADLPVRIASAVVMVLVAGSALWIGGPLWILFVSLIALGVLWEWRGLVRGFELTTLRRIGWLAGGFVYVGIAALHADGSEVAALVEQPHDRLGEHGADCARRYEQERDLPEAGRDRRAEAIVVPAGRESRERGKEHGRDRDEGR